MKKILSASVLAIAVSTSSFAVAPAFADTYVQVCVENHDGTWFPYVIESQDDLDYIGDRNYETFPNTPGGCSGYGPVVGASPDSHETECEPKVVEVTSVQTVTPEGFGEVAPYKAKIKRLRSKVAKLKRKLAAARR